MHGQDDGNTKTIAVGAFSLQVALIAIGISTFFR